MVQERRYKLGWGSDNVAELTLGKVYQDSRPYRTEIDRRRAIDELSAIGDRKQAEIESRLGRPLTDQEGSEGVQHKERRDIGQQMADRQRYKDVLNLPPPPPLTEAETYRALVAQHEDDKAKEADPKGWELRQALKTAEAKEKAAADYKAMMADPKRPIALRAATTWLTEILFDPSATAAEVEHARFLLDLAWTTSDWSGFNTEMNQARQTRAAAIDTQSAPTEAAWKAAKAAREKLSKPFEV